MDDPVPNPDGEREVRYLTRLLRACFDGVIEQLTPDALVIVREQCVRAEHSAANMEIIATIDRRLARLRGCRLPGS